MFKVYSRETKNTRILDRRKVEVQSLVHPGVEVSDVKQV